LSITLSDNDRPIRLVTFDLYDTLIELYPHRWDRLRSALSKLQIDAELDVIRQADVIAEDFFTAENGRVPIRDRPGAEREVFRLEYMRIWLEAIGLPSDERTVRAARENYLAEFDVPAIVNPPFEGYRVFDDVLPSLRRLRDTGVGTAIISNADSDVTELCLHLALADEMDLIVTSALVGWEKPDIRTFRAAFEPLGIDPADALHIGDQPKSDVMGALNAGMRAALIDRYGRHDPLNHNVPVFGGLDDLTACVLTVNDAVSVKR
jgi:HAD superfamily hydrolase (TIGR01509 family)